MFSHIPFFFCVLSCGNLTAVAHDSTLIHGALINIEAIWACLGGLLAPRYQWYHPCCNMSLYYVQYSVGYLGNYKVALLQGRFARLVCVRKEIITLDHAACNQPV